MSADERALDERALREKGFQATVGESLSRHTTFAIGGPADLFVVVETQERFQAALECAAHLSLPCFILGGGSNLLVRDGGLAGLVIKDATRGWTVADSAVTVASGEPLAPFVKSLASQGLGGLEFLAGIPGTVGGAVCGNAGAFGESISSRILSVSLSKNGSIIDTSTACLGFDYRTSNLKKSVGLPPHETGVVLGVTLAIDGAPTYCPLTRVEETLAQREGRLPPWDVPSAGSYFKNLPPETPGGRRRAAGLFLDQVGAKGMRVGDAEVFQGHANIIINRGAARATDVLTLASRLARLVEERFDLVLQPEVLCVGRD